MKKVIKIFMFICAFCVMTSVYAGTAYVDNININAKINKDGSMTVTETIVWDIEADLNGVYRDILIQNEDNKINSASRIVVNSVSVNGKPFNYSHSTLQNGDSGKYNVNSIEGGKQIKIFTPSSDETKTTTIEYTLYDVIVKYNDIAELYWNFIGSGWDYGIENVFIRITLPGESSTLKVFAHGPLHGYSKITGTDSIILEVEKLRSGELVDARLLFDISLVNTTKNVYKNVLEGILTEEAKLTEEANIKRENAKKYMYISIIIAVVAIIIPIFACIAVKRRAYKATFKGKYYRELPEDYGPAIMSKVVYGTLGNTSAQDMLATLLDMTRRKYVEIEPIYKDKKNKPYDYNLKLIKTDLSELNEQEVHFIQQLIFVDTTEISLKDLSKKNSKTLKAQSMATSAYTKWCELIEKVAKDKELIGKVKCKFTKYILLSLLIFPLTIAIVLCGTIMEYEDIMTLGIATTFVGVIEEVIVVLLIEEMRTRTRKGVEHKAMWEAFKKFLQDFSKLDEYDYKSMAIWEHYLVYATALGVAKKVIKQLKIVFPTEFQENGTMFSHYTTMALLSDGNTSSNFQSAFSSAVAIAFSAPSSSDGSGGGFVGGAGGRRRRWRRWRILASNKYSI